MARAKKDYVEIHRAADKFEVQLENRFLRAAANLQEWVPIDEMALNLARAQGAMPNTKVVDAVMKLFPIKDMKDLFAPMGTTTKNAFMRGGHVGAKQVNDA